MSAPSTPRSTASTASQTHDFEILEAEGIVNN